MSTCKCAVIKEAGGKFEMQEREIPTPGPGQVLIKVQACGVCHSDKFAVFGACPGCELPRVPGHEVIGTVEKVGDGVKWPPVGVLASVGWHCDHCQFCESCHRGDSMMCPNSKVSGTHSDGGHAECTLAHWTGIAETPEGLDPVTAAPLLCAGIAVFNSTRHQGDSVHPGDLVAVQGTGGLGHLGIQFAKKMGFQVAAVSSSDSKKEPALKLGADHHIDASDEPASKLLKALLGGAKLVLATAPNSKSMEDLVSGLGANGRLLIVGADDNTLPNNKKITK